MRGVLSSVAKKCKLEGSMMIQLDCRSPTEKDSMTYFGLSNSPSINQGQVKMVASAEIR